MLLVFFRYVCVFLCCSIIGMCVLNLLLLCQMVSFWVVDVLFLVVFYFSLLMCFVH